MLETTHSSVMANPDIYKIPLKTIEGKDTTLEPHKGKVLLIVNVASKCGFTPQYEGLEKLHEKYQSQGLVVLGFPCNQFMAQEPGDAASIKNFCSLTYQVKFPLFAKVDVNGPTTHPLYRVLKKEARGVLWTETIKWNFTKFLVNREGRVVGRFPPNMEPVALSPEIEKHLHRIP